MYCVQVVTGILLISAEQDIFKQYFLLKQLYEIGPRALFIKLLQAEIVLDKFCC